MNRKTSNITISAICISLAMILPFLTGQIPQIGAMLAPMHLPILICGLLCSPLYAVFVGAISPLLRFGIFGMPPLFPIGIAMSFELATYALVASFMHKKHGILSSLITAMIFGRLVWGTVMAIIAGVSGISFGFKIFIMSAFVNAVPAIILQLILVPLVVKAVDNRRQLGE